jgi:hypothetical protein
MDKNQVMEYLSNRGFNEYFFSELSPELLNDDEVISKAIDTMTSNTAPSPLKFANPRFLQNREFVERVIRKSVFTLKDELSIFNDDPDMIMIAVEANDLWGFKFAGPKLKNDPEFVKQVIAKGGRVLDLLDLDENSEILDNKEIVLAAIENGETVGNISRRLQNDKEVMAKAISVRSYNYQYIGDELKDDVDLAVQALKDDYGFNEQFLSDELKQNPEIIKIREAKKDEIRKSAIELGAEELMYPERFEQYVDARLGYSFTSANKAHFELMRDLENGVPFREIVEKIDKDEAYRYGDNFLLNYSKKGPEFYSYYVTAHEGRQLEGVELEEVQRIEKENAEYAENEKKRGHSIEEVGAVAETRTESELADTMKEMDNEVNRDEQEKDGKKQEGDQLE